MEFKSLSRSGGTNSSIEEIDMLEGSAWISASTRISLQAGTWTATSSAPAFLGSLLAGLRGRVGSLTEGALLLAYSTLDLYKVIRKAFDCIAETNKDLL